MSKLPFLNEARKSFHAALLEQKVLGITAEGIPSNADKGNKLSISVGFGIAELLGCEARGAKLKGQMAGKIFEDICSNFLAETFSKLGHLRPGSWHVGTIKSKKNQIALSNFEQYYHLKALYDAAQASVELATALGNDYIITPDVLIYRDPEKDETINHSEIFLDETIALLTGIRKSNNHLPLLHASVSCKWTLRSDRAQNARSEGLNLVRNRKGKLPHIVVITAEPTPSRIASIALGTGDIDCVYHFALPELVETIKGLGHTDAEDSLHMMIEGKRLRDIADLPLDLVI